MPAPAYEIEHIPVSGPTVRQSLAAWGCSFQLRRENWGIDQLQLTDTTDGSPFVAPVFGYLDQVCLWRDGSRHWRGWVTRPAAQATPQSDARPYTILGAGWWLAISPWALGWTGTRTSRTVGNWVHLALQRAIYVGAPIALSDTPETDYALSMRAPDLLDSDMCWTLIQRAARYAPNSAGWWDDSGPVSIFRTRERADLTPVSLARGTQVSTVDELAALNESQLHAVRLIYGHWYDGLGGETWETYTRDRAGDNDYAGPANLLEVRVTVDSYDAALTSVGYHIAEKLYAALNPLSWAGQLTCDESVAALPLIRPGQVVNITGGNAEWATMNAVVAAVELSATPEADTCTIQLGPPPPLGPQDYMELFRIAGQAGNSVSGNPTPFPPPTPPTLDPGNPGTLDDLNGGTAGAPPAAALVQQRRGGSYSIVGCPPLDGIEASPPRRWLAQAWAGTIAGSTYYGNGTCGGAATGTTDVTLSGAAAWSPLNGDVVTNIGLYRNVWWLSTPESGVTENGLTAGANLDMQVGWKGSAGATRATTAATDTYTASGACVDVNGDGTVSARDTGAWSTTLSDECTEQRAIDAQSVGLEWYAADYARRTERTGLSFVAERLRYGVGTPGEGDTMIATEGWTPWGIYEIRVSIQQRPIDGAGELTVGSEWTEQSEIVHRIQANLDGEAKLDWQEAPEPPHGYAIRAVLSVPIAPITS